MINRRKFIKHSLLTTGAITLGGNPMRILAQNVGLEEKQIISLYTICSRGIGVVAPLNLYNCILGASSPFDLHRSACAAADTLYSLGKAQTMAADSASSANACSCLVSAVWSGLSSSPDRELLDQTFGGAAYGDILLTTKNPKVLRDMIQTSIAGPFSSYDFTLKSLSATFLNLVPYAQRQQQGVMESEVECEAPNPASLVSSYFNTISQYDDGVYYHGRAMHLMGTYASPTNDIHRSNRLYSSSAA